MSKKTNRTAAPAKSSPPPSAENPGSGGELPPEVIDPKSQTERQREREASEIFSLFRRELGSSGFVTLHRSHPPTGQFKMGYIGTMPSDEFTIERVSALYGGGDFIARGRTSAGTFNEERRFTIDHSLPPKNPQAPAQDKKADAPPALDVPALVRAIHDAQPKAPDNSGLVEIVKAALARPEPKGETAAMLEMIKEIREDSRKAEDRFFKLLEKMSERNAPPPAPSLREQLEEARELLDLIGGDRGGSDKGDSFWKDLGRGAAEALGPIIKNHFAGAAPALMGALPSAAVPVADAAAPASSVSPQTDAVNGHAAEATPQPDPAAAAAPSPDMNISMQFFLTQFRKQALDAARRGKDAFEWVDDVIGLVPHTMLPGIFAIARGEDWFVKIFGADPEAMKATKFLNEMRAAVLVKALAMHARHFASVKKSAEETARAFLGWAPRDFDDELFNTSSDLENWAAAFEGGTALDPAWLEQLRTAFVTALDAPEAATAAAGGDGQAAAVAKGKKK